MHTVRCYSFASLDRPAEEQEEAPSHDSDSGPPSLDLDADWRERSSSADAASEVYLDGRHSSLANQSVVAQEQRLCCVSVYNSGRGSPRATGVRGHQQRKRYLSREPCGHLSRT